MLGFLFKPEEVKRALDTVGAVRDKVNTPAFGLVEGEVRARITRESTKTVASIREDKLPYETLIYLLVTNVIDGKLCSGQFHNYRGILNTQGDWLLELWDRAVGELVKLGFYDPSTGEQEKQYIRAEIKKAG